MKTVLSSRIRLARNYEDLPFDVTNKPASADMCIARTMNALKLSGADDGFHLLHLAHVPQEELTLLQESHLITADLITRKETAAVLLNEDKGISLMMNEEDHLRLQARASGNDLRTAADHCFRLEDALSQQVSFAFDHQLGYLTAYPTNTGTGMRASLLVHLPLLSMGKQMGNVGQIVAKVGLNIRGVYGEGQEALGYLYQVSNQVTLGRTEQELIATLTAVGQQLSDMEAALGEKELSERRLQLEDRVYRAWGTLCNARFMSLNEFYRRWSNLRLGIALHLLPLSYEEIDPLLEQVQEAHLCAWAEKSLSDDELDAARASYLRRMIAHQG